MLFLLQKKNAAAPTMARPPTTPTTIPPIAPPERPPPSDGAGVSDVGKVVAEAAVLDAGLEVADADEEAGVVLVARSLAGSKVYELAAEEAELSEEKVSFICSEDRFARVFSGVAQQMLIWSKRECC